MARTQRDSRIESRDARLKLKAQREPYWRRLEKGLAIGYRRIDTGAGSWLVRRFDGTRYHHARIATADDFGDADGGRVLDYAQAQRKALQQADTTAGIVHAGGDPSYTVGDALDAYLDWYRAHRKGVSQTERTIDGIIRPAWGTVRVSDLNAPALRRWHQGLIEPRTEHRKRGRTTPRSRSTANRILTVLKAALNFAWGDGHGNRDAWQRVKPFRDADEARIRYLDPKDCRALLAACPADFRELVHAALVTGARFGELVALEVDDFHHQTGGVSIRDSKSGEPRHVWLTDEGRELFARHVKDKARGARIFTREDGRPWGTSDQTRPMRAACKAAKIDPPVSFHILRHTHASQLALAGTPMAVIARQLGHADLRMTMKHYAHLSPDYQAKAIRAGLPTFDAEAKPQKVRKLRGRARA